MGAIQSLPFFRKSTKHLATKICVPNLATANVEKLEEFLDKELKNTGIPGLSLSFVAQSVDESTNKKQWHEWNYNYGYCDVNEQNPATSNTIYHLHSGTNVFTAMAVMQLLDSNKIKSLNDPVYQYLPQSYLNDSKYSKIFSSNFTQKQLTLQSLLTHSSYLKDNPKGFMQLHFPRDQSDNNDDDDDSYNDVTCIDALYDFGRLKQKSKIKQLWHRYKNPFRWTFFEYSDNSEIESILLNSETKYAHINYALLGAIVENLSQMTFDEYIEENILNKLDMNAFFKFNDIYNYQNENVVAKENENNKNDNEKKNNNNSIRLWEHIARPYIGGWDTLRWHIWRKLDAKTRDRLSSDYLPNLNLIEFNDFEMNCKSTNGLLTSSNQLIKFLKYQIDCQDIDKNNILLLSPLSLKRMQTLQKRGHAGVEAKYGMGLGWKIGHVEIMEPNEHEIMFINHEGTGYGATSEMRIYPQYRCGIVILCNYTGIKHLPKTLHKLCQIVFAARNTICGVEISAISDEDQDEELVQARETQIPDDVDHPQPAVQ